MLITEETRAENQAAVTAYTHGSIEINGQVYCQAVVIRGNNIDGCNKNCPTDLLIDDFLNKSPDDKQLPEVILVGTGAQQVFLHPKITVALAERGIGLECMSTAAACRTLMLLQSEQRRVWAWLWP